MNKTHTVWNLTASALLVCGMSFHSIAQAEVSVPHVFENGTTADADEVNANFNAVVDGINAVEVGLKGETGAAGAMGDTGLSGPPGPRGDVGATGASGADGLNAAAPTVYAIGDTGPAGGWVFYVDADGRHGLEAASGDQSADIHWYNSVLGDADTEAHGDGLGAGEMNTMLIIASQGNDSTLYAAGLCANLVITSGGFSYGDWYLPSKYELNLMYLNIGQGNIANVNVGGFADDWYWSSTEFVITRAWQQSFVNGGQSKSFLKTEPMVVRAVRSF